MCAAISFFAISPAAAQLATDGHDVESPDSQTIQVDGVVIDRQKYSFTLNALDRQYKVFIPNGTPVALQLSRPEIDWNQRQVLMTLPISASSGNASENKVFRYPLPTPALVTAQFASEQRKQQATSAKLVRLNRFLIHAAPLPGSDSPMMVQGELQPGQQPDSLQLQVGDTSYPVVLGPRNGRLVGFSILELEPNVTDAFVSGVFDGEQLIADSIVFAPVGNPLDDEDSSLPRILFLGDSVSFNYQRPLREALRGIVNLHHPPTNCGGSNNWRSIHRWVGNYEKRGRGWDVITFNFGLRDEKTTKAAYQTNLRRAIEQLSKTGARLVWVNSTPIPYPFLNLDATNRNSQSAPALNEAQRQQLVRQASALTDGQLVGHLPGRMALQNRWASEVLAEFPEIAVCDLWKTVKENQASVFERWWFGNSFNFEYTQSVFLARELAGSIMRALGRDADEIHPPDVHTIKDKSAEK